MKPLRSNLFVPGNKRDWMLKAPRYGADCLVLDLEDSVPVAEKAAARKEVRAALEELTAQAVTCTVRVNEIGLGMEQDLEALACPALISITAPKCETPQQMERIDSLLAQAEARARVPFGHIRITAALETAPGIHYAYAIASHPRVERIVAAAGRGGDTQRSLRYLWSKTGEETLYIRSHVLLEARAAGIEYPIVANWFAIDDPEGFEHMARQNRALGYRGMSLIHPSHVEPVNRIFSPTPEEIAYAQGVLAAMEAAEKAGTAAVTYEGAMVDIAMVKTARDLLDFAESIGLA